MAIIDASSTRGTLSDGAVVVRSKVVPGKVSIRFGRELVRKFKLPPKQEYRVFYNDACRSLLVVAAGDSGRFKFKVDDRGHWSGAVTLDDWVSKVLFVGDRHSVGGDNVRVLDKDEAEAVNSTLGVALRFGKVVEA